MQLSQILTLFKQNSYPNNEYLIGFSKIPHSFRESFEFMKANFPSVKLCNYSFCGSLKIGKRLGFKVEIFVKHQQIKKNLKSKFLAKQNMCNCAGLQKIVFL